MFLQAFYPCLWGLMLNFKMLSLSNLSTISFIGYAI